MSTYDAGWCGNSSPHTGERHVLARERESTTDLKIAGDNFVADYVMTSHIGRRIPLGRAKEYAGNWSGGHGDDDKDKFVAKYDSCR